MTDGAEPARPFPVLKSFLSTRALSQVHRPAALLYLREVEAVLQPRFAALPQDPPVQGMIHGDVIRANSQADRLGGCLDLLRQRLQPQRG